MTLEDIEELLKEKQSYQRNHELVKFAVHRGFQLRTNTPMNVVESFLEHWVKKNKKT